MRNQAILRLLQGLKPKTVQKSSKVKFCFDQIFRCFCRCIQTLRTTSAYNHLCCHRRTLSIHISPCHVPIPQVLLSDDINRHLRFGMLAGPQPYEGIAYANQLAAAEPKVYYDRQTNTFVKNKGSMQEALAAKTGE